MSMDKLVGFMALAGIILLMMNITYTTQDASDHKLKIKQDKPHFWAEYQRKKPDFSFDQWMKWNKKTYESIQERTYRSFVYQQNLLRIKMHNIKFQLGQSTYFKGVNHFTDLTIQQFLSKYTKKLKTPTTQASDSSLSITKQCKGSIMDAPNPPDQLDWGNKVSQVGDQGQCGKAWAMTSTSAIQSLYALKMGSLPSLSDQQLLQCSTDYGNQGCDGGFMQQAYHYIIDNGIATRKTYQDRDQVKPCKYTLNMKFTSIRQCARIPPLSYSKLLSAIVQQPVTVAMDFSPDMKQYQGGIFDKTCTKELTHAMLLVGYGGEKEDQWYWKLKNSMGKKWGQMGYMLLRRTGRDGEGECGVQRMASVPQGIA